ncbi:MAG: PIN domain-containing protein [Pseudomonadales bacterium]|nr:PIN domain-containing protein [Pseudomonadales bacterium]
MSGVIIDTCIWSLAFRGTAPREAKVAHQISVLIDENRAKIIGLIRQEVLSGYSNYNDYAVLRDKLSYFPNEPTLDSDYEIAAEYSNLCRKKGIQGSHTDFLICAVAIRLKLLIYTNDKDLRHYSKHLPLALFAAN